MSTSRTKVALQATQATTAICTLDFTAAQESYEAALRAVEGFGEATEEREEAFDRLTDTVWAAADRLLGTPAATNVQIAAKVAAYQRLHNTEHSAADFHDPRWRLSVAHHGDDASKGLLAIYLDLIQTRDDSAWREVAARYQAARDAVDAAYEAEGDEDPTEEQYEALRLARLELLSTRAPDVSGLAFKLAALIQSQFTEDADDSPTNPATITRMLADDPAEQYVASIYQDALGLSGLTGPLVEAKPDTFDPEAWLAETGDPETDAKARDAFDALPFGRQQKVSRAVHRSRPMPAVQVAPPAEMEEVRALFLNGYLNTFPQGEREAVRAKLEAQ